MEETVRENMLSDVSCGVLLSGGLDSSIVAYEAIRADRNINSYTCREDRRNDEDVINAIKYAKHIGAKVELLISVVHH